MTEEIVSYRWCSAEKKEGAIGVVQHVFWIL
jgi:hypothetical protein